MADDNDPLKGFKVIPVTPQATTANDPLKGFRLPPDPQQGFINAGNVVSTFGNWLRPKEDPSLAGVGQTALDMTRTAGNTFGLGDRAIAQGRATLPMMYPSLFGPGGNPADQSKIASDYLTEEQAKSAEARDRLGGALSTTAEMAGYGPFTELGIAGRTADALGTAAPIVRKVIGQAVEGGVGGGLAAAGHGQNVPLGVLAGAATPLALSPITGPVSWASKNIATKAGQATGWLSKPEDVIDATKTAKDAALAGTDLYNFASTAPAAAYRGSMSSLTGPQQQGLSSDMKNAFTGHVKAITNKPTVSATDIDGYGRRLSEAATTRDDKVLAAKVNANLNGYVLGATSPVTGQPVGSALLKIEEARQAAQQHIMAKGITDAKSNLAQKFYSPGPWAEDQSQWYDPNSPVGTQLAKIIRTSGGQQGLDAHTASRLTGLGAEAVGGAVGGPGGALVGGAAVDALHPAIKGLTKTLQRGSLQNQLSDLYGPATGMPTTFTPKLFGMTPGEAIRQATLASEAGRGY